MLQILFNGDIICFNREVRMETYSVKQIADMLNTKPETVRRWIRSGKLKAEQSSRKDGNVITEGDLNNFLKSSPKYAGLIAGAIGLIAGPIAAIPLAGGIAAYLAMEKERENPSFSKDDIKKYLEEEIAKRDASMKQKLKTIKQMQQEIANDQQQISECKFVLSQLEEKRG